MAAVGGGIDYEVVLVGANVTNPAAVDYQFPESLGPVRLRSVFATFFSGVVAGARLLRVRHLSRTGQEIGRYPSPALAVNDVASCTWVPGVGPHSAIGQAERNFVVPVSTHWSPFDTLRFDVEGVQADDVLSRVVFRYWGPRLSSRPRGQG